MGEIFRVGNYPDINLQDSSALTADADSGQKEIKVLGTAGFAADDIGLIGVPGSAVGEINIIDSFDATSVTFDNDLINPHRQTEPYTTLFGDKIRMYRVANVTGYPPPDTDFLLVSTTDIDQDSPVSILLDTTGGAGYWYKFTYYNSVSHAETPLSSSFPMRGGGFGHYCSIEEIRREAGLANNEQIQDTQIATRRDQAESQVKGALLAADYVLPLRDAKNNFFVPEVLANITRILAAGYVLSQDYGVEAPDSSKDGEKKIKLALSILTGVQDHTTILVDINEAQMSVNERVKGWPDDTTKFVGTDGNTPEPSVFTMGRRF